MLLSLAFTTALAGQIGGIGLILTQSSAGPKIVNVVPGSPAETGGQVRSGDVILAVAQGNETPMNVVGMPLAKVVDLIRGPEGSVVRLTLMPAGKTEGDVTQIGLTRSTLKLPSPAPRSTGILMASASRHRLQIPWPTVILTVSISILLICVISRMMRRNR